MNSCLRNENRSTEVFEKSSFLLQIGTALQITYQRMEDARVGGRELHAITDGIRVTRSTVVTILVELGS